MATTAIHVVPDDSFDDRIVRDDAGCEFGHFPTREAAELTAKAIVQEREAELIIHFPDGRTTRKSFSKGWAGQIVQAMIGESADTLLCLDATDMLPRPRQQLRQ